MSTQKIKPDPGFVDRQRDHQHTTERRRKAGAFVVAAAIGLAAVVAIVATRPDGNATPPANSTSPSPAVTLAPGQPFLVDIGTGAATPISGNIDGGKLYSVSPDGTRIVYGHCCTTQDVVTIASLNQNTDAHVVWSTHAGAYAPAWSPDSSKIVYQSRNASTNEFGSLMVRDVAAGQTTLLAKIPGGNGWWAMFPKFSPDGRSVLFQVARKPSGFDLWSVPATGGTPTLVLRNAGFGQYFPDGKRIAFVGGMSSDLSGTRVSIASPDGTRRTLVKSSVGALGGLSVSPDGTHISYLKGTTIYVVDVSTGQTRAVASGDAASWVNNDTIIVGP